MPLQWRNQFSQSLEEGAGKQGLECVAVSEFENLISVIGIMYTKSIRADTFKVQTLNLY